MKLLKLLSLLMIMYSCKSTKVNSTIVFKDFFDNKETFNNQWEKDTHSTAKTYYLKNNHLKISNKGKIKDNVKVQTKKNNFSLGTYTWRIFIPKFDLHEQRSIGAFLYHYNQPHYELDFEIGSGKKIIRENLNASQNEALVLCSSQNHPKSDQDYFKIETETWHIFTLKLSSGIDKNYLVEWFIDGKKVKKLQTHIKTSTTFRVHNSLENLPFIGDHIPLNDSHVLFDSFTYSN